MIVKFHGDISFTVNRQGQLRSNNQSFNRILSAYSVDGASRIFSDNGRSEALPWKNYYLLRTQQKQSIQNLLDELNSHPAVMWAELNHAYKIHYVPNDSLFPQQWALQTLSMPQAWDIEKGSPQIVIGVIDTGLDYLHPDLREQLWVNNAEDLHQNGRLDPGDINEVDDDGNGYVDDVIGWDFTDAPDFPDEGDYLNPDNDPMDEFPGGHGTPVSGIIGAATDNGTGMAGIAPGVRIMPLRAGTASGFLEEDDVAEAIVYAVQNGCRIINMSFGDVVYSHLIKDAVTYGTRQGVLFVASSGNAGNNTLNYPASYDETISVGATARHNNLAGFSSFGSKIDLVAPGQEILSVVPENQYGAFSGTSFSAPMVSAALGLLWSKNPRDSSILIKSKLLNSCIDLGSSGWDVYYGHGLLNIYRSLTTDQNSIVQIDSPQTGSGVLLNKVPVMGSAVGSDMQKYTLSYGAGEMPPVWHPFYESSEQLIHDTLGIWNTSQLPDSVYTLELKIINRDLSTVVQRVIVHLDRTAPVLDSLKILPMMVEDLPGYFIQVNTDDRTAVSLYYRHTGGTEPFQEVTSGYFNDEHYFLLSQHRINGYVEFYLNLENTSGLRTRADNNHRHYKLDLSQPNTLIEDFRKIDEKIGFGYLLPETADLDQDGITEIIAQVAWADYPGPRITTVNFDSGYFNRWVGPIPAFPRDLLDVDGDSVPDLLAGYGGVSYLFPGYTLPQFSGNPVQCPQDDFWAARFIKLSQGRGTTILAIQQGNWHLFRLENFATFSVTRLQTLQNPSSGENSYGVPYAQTADLDQDGKPEIIIGDYDGDVILYESNGQGAFDPVFHKRLPGKDATSRFDVGDFDGDGVLELAVATQQVAEYVGESAVAKQYWIVTILKATANNWYQIAWQQNFHGLAEGKNRFSGLTAADFDGDGRAEIFFTPYPRAYYIQFRHNQYQVNWYYRGVNSNAVPQPGENRFVLVSDSTFMLWERRTDEQRPLPPARTRILSADTAHIRLEWEAVSGADHYLVNRTDLINQNGRIFRVWEPSLDDTTVLENAYYGYRIQTVDSSFLRPVSISGRIIKVRAENPPQFLHLRKSSISQLLLTFSGPLGDGSYQIDHYLLFPDSLKPVSAIRGQGRRQVLLSFPEPFEQGEHQLVFSDLQTIHDVPFYPDSFRVTFYMESFSEPPYLKNIEMLSKKELRIVFSQPMDRTSVEDITHYRFYPDDRVTAAKQDTMNRSLIYLYLTGQNRMGSLGENYYLEISDLKNIDGVQIQRGWGNRYLIHREVSNLEEMVVFPNPYRAGRAKNEITFGNLPNGCEIFIYTANGRQVARLKETDNNGGVGWNLRNHSGREVQSGVYLFVAQHGEEKKRGKFVILK